LYYSGLKVIIGAWKGLGILNWPIKDRNPTRFIKKARKLFKLIIDIRFHMDLVLSVKEVK